MKKVMSLILVGVFALSFVAGIMATTTKADPVPICGFVSCDYNKERVKLICYNPNSGKTRTVWSDDPAYFERWCL